MSLTRGVKNNIPDFCQEKLEIQNVINGNIDYRDKRRYKRKVLIDILRLSCLSVLFDMRKVLYGFGNKPKIAWGLESIFLQYHTVFNNSGNFGQLKVDFSQV